MESVYTSTVWLKCLLVCVFYHLDNTLACPKECFCAPHSRNVQCSNQDLHQIPDGIPAETVELNLNENKFVQPALTGLNWTDLYDVQNLYLSDTGLEVIAAGTFSNMSQLSWLDLSKNKIHYLADFTFRGLRLKHLFINDNPDLKLSTSVFVGMTTQGLYMNNCGLKRLSIDIVAPLNGSLKTLWLHGNNLTKLDEKWRYFYRKLAHVRLGGNAFHCNCELLWLHLFYSNSRVSLFAGGDPPHCHSPSYVQGKNFDGLTSEDFRCELPTFQSVDAVFDTKIGKLTCTARGDPVPTISWIRPDGSSETFFVKSELEAELNSAVILFTNRKIESKETYKCLALNQAGNVSFSLNVVWPDMRIYLTTTKKPADSSHLPGEALHSNYVNDDSLAYDTKSNNDNNWVGESVSGLVDIDRHFDVADVAGAVLGTFLLTLLATITFIHLFCRARLVSGSEDLYIASQQIIHKHNDLSANIVNEMDENSVKMINTDYHK